MRIHEEQLLEQAGRLFSRKGLRKHSFLLYRLTPSFEIPFSKLTHPRILGALTQDVGLAKKVVLRLSFARAEGDNLKLVFKNSYKRVVITGLLESVVLRYLKGYTERQPHREADDICISLLCNSRDEAEHLCLYLRQCKRISQAKRQKIRQFDQARVRIAVEQGRLHSLLLQHFQTLKLQQHTERFLRSSGLRSELAFEHLEHILGREAQKEGQRECSEQANTQEQSEGEQQQSAGQQSGEEGQPVQQQARQSCAGEEQSGHWQVQTAGEQQLCGQVNAFAQPNLHQFRSKLFAANSK